MEVASYRATDPGVRDMIFLLRRFPRELRRLMPSVMLSFVATMAEAAVIIAVVPLIEAVAEDRADLESSIGPLDLNLQLGGLTAFVLVGIAVMLLAQGAAVWARARVVTRFSAHAKLGLYRAYLDADWATKHSERTGRLQQLSSYAVATSNVLNAAGQVVGISLGLGVFLAAAFVVDLWSAIAITTFAVVMTAALSVLHRYRKRLGAANAKAGLVVAETVGEIVDNVGDITTMGVESHFARQVGNPVARVAALERRAQVVGGLGGPLYRAMGLVVIVVAVLIASTQETLDVTTFGAAALLLLRSLGYGQALQVAYGTVANGLGSVHRYLGARAEFDDNPTPSGHRPLVAPVRLELRSVHFAYDDEGEALTEVSFGIGPGEIVGLAGPSGAGKSTLAQIVMGLRLPTEGEYLVNGHPAHEHRLPDRARLWAFVPQQTRLLHASVAENIGYFRPHLSREDIERAAASAGIDETIRGLPEGYETPVGVTTRALSGGQVQRIGIARALAGGPCLIVLDEPTSALDANAERVVHETIDQLRGAATVIVIAHRESTLMTCDRVLMLEGGRLVFDGAVEEVLALLRRGSVLDGSLFLTEPTS